VRVADEKTSAGNWDRIDFLLVGMIIALYFVGVYLLLPSPMWWDESPRILSHVWSSLGAAMVAMLSWMSFGLTRSRPTWSIAQRIGCCLLLLTAAVSLLAQLFWPTVEQWENRVRPGAQVCRQYIGRRSGGKGTAATRVAYLLYLPPGYDESRKWPLVVFLHGSGERGYDLSLVRRTGLPEQVEQGRNLDFVLVSPQCPAQSGWIAKDVIELIEHISRSLSIDRERVYLTGHSMGGFGTWEIAGADPGRFAAIAPLCGGDDIGQATRLAGMPIWAFHGDKDAVVPLKASQAMVDAVRNCGGHVRFTVLAGYGHGIGDVIYQDPQLYDWLLAQRRNGRLQRTPAAVK
jgi:predicted esterase